MRPYLITFACLCSALAFVTAVPVPASNQELDVLQIPLSNGKELDVLTLGSRDQEQLIAERNKRTIGLLRDLFPDITKQLDQEINRFVNNILKQLGPIVLGTVLNPLNDHPRLPLNEADVDDELDVNANNGTLSNEFTVYEPDGDFERSQEKREDKSGKEKTEK
ncbi:hypothetical protein CVS40_3232 [Lucilia cuprina]|nr:hypothetical protein CVS40_3232 [Lucilia cuprina]